MIQKLRPHDLLSNRPGITGLWPGQFPVYATLVIIVLLLIQPVSGFVIVEYFHQDGCVNCVKTDPIIRSIQERYPRDRVSVTDIKIDNREAVKLLMSYGRTEVPIIVINHVRVIEWPEITKDRLDEEIRLAESGAYPDTGTDSLKSSLIRSGYPAIVFSYFLGIMTALSPCLLGSLVVIFTATTKTAISGAGGRFYATVFGAGLVSTYLLVAAGVLFAGFRLSAGSGFSMTIFTIAGLISIGFGILQLGFIRLPDPGVGGIMRMFSRFNTIRGAFFLGIIFAVILAPCAGAPFLVLLDTLLMTGSVADFGIVIAFGSGVMTPFLLISITSSPLPNERLIRYSTLIQRASGILLIAFGIWLLAGI